MMSRFTGLLLLLTFIGFVPRTSGQSKGVYITQGEMRLYTQNDSLREQLHLKNLLDTHDGLYWRFYFPYDIGTFVIMDIHRLNDSKYRGILTLYTAEYVDASQEKPTNRIYSLKIKINVDEAFKIGKLIGNINLKDIKAQQVDTVLRSDGAMVITMVDYTDGSPRHFEYADDKQYAFKVAWKLSEDSVINAFVKDVQSIVDFKTLNLKFQKKVPFEAYTTGWMIKNKILTDKQKEQYKKERDKYRKDHEL